MTEDALHDFYERLDQQIKTKSVGTSRIYNFDETGVAEGETSFGRVLGTSLTKESIVTDSDSREWATINECVSASGQRLAPCVVFVGNNLKDSGFLLLFLTGAMSVVQQAGPKVGSS